MRIKSISVFLLFLICVALIALATACSSKTTPIEGSSVEPNQADSEQILATGSKNKYFDDLGVDVWMGKGWGKDAYTFPNYDPATINNADERVAALTVPDTMLRSMSTQGLIRTVVGSPITGSFNFSEKPSDGVNTAKKYYNCVAELLFRDDTPKYLIQLYRKIDMKNFPEGVMFPIFQYSFVEALLGQPEILSKMSKGERQQLLVVLQQNSKIKETWKDHSWFFAQRIMFWSMSRIIAYDDPNFANRFVGLSTYLESGASIEIESNNFQALHDYVMSYGQ